MMLSMLSWILSLFTTNGQHQSSLSRLSSPHVYGMPNLGSDQLSHPFAFSDVTQQEIPHVFRKTSVGRQEGGHGSYYVMSPEYAHHQSHIPHYPIFPPSSTPSSHPQILPVPSHIASSHPKWSTIDASSLQGFQNHHYPIQQRKPTQNHQQQTENTRGNVLASDPNNHRQVYVGAILNQLPTDLMDSARKEEEHSQRPTQEAPDEKLLRTTMSSLEKEMMGRGDIQRKNEGWISFFPPSRSSGKQDSTTETVLSSTHVTSVLSPSIRTISPTLFSSLSSTSSNSFPPSSLWVDYFAQSKSRLPENHTNSSPSRRHHPFLLTTVPTTITSTSTSDEERLSRDNGKGNRDEQEVKTSSCRIKTTFLIVCCLFTVAFVILLSLTSLLLILRFRRKCRELILHHSTSSSLPCTSCAFEGRHRVSSCTSGWQQEAQHQPSNTRMYRNNRSHQLNYWFGRHGGGGTVGVEVD